MHLLSIPCIAMAAINFYLGFYYFVFYLKRPQIRAHLPFALLCLSVALYQVFSAGLYDAQTLAEGIIWQRLQLNIANAISITLVWFTSIFTQQTKNRWLTFARIGFLGFFLLSWLLNPGMMLSPENPSIKRMVLFDRVAITYYEAEVGLFYQIQLMLAIVIYLYLCYLFIRYYQKTQYRSSLLILGCLIIYFLGVINDTLVVTEIYSFIYLSEYAFFFLVLVMAYTLLDRFVRLQNSFEELNSHLERRVIERTHEITALNKKLRKLAERDGLTGVYNRRFFNEYLEIELKRARSFVQHQPQLDGTVDPGMNFGLSLIDIDHYKQVNDHLGHLVGDALLKHIVRIIEQNMFSRDVLCRYGGDEFALLLTKTSPDGILQAMEKIRREIDEHVFNNELDSTGYHITISVGLATFDEVPEVDSEAIVKLADDRLLQAKNLGRNRVVYKPDNS